MDRAAVRHGSDAWVGEGRPLRRRRPARWDDPRDGVAPRRPIAKGVGMRELTPDERDEIARDATLPQLDARELVDEEYLERAIKEMYTEVATNPGGRLRVEGADRLGRHDVPVGVPR